MSSAEGTEDGTRRMRVATYSVAGLGVLAWIVPIAVIGSAIVDIYQRGFFPSFAMSVTTIGFAFWRHILMSVIGCLFSLLAPIWLRSRGSDNWALGLAFLSLGAGFVFAVLPEIIPYVLTR
jgi:uncharacterized membrane protein